MKSSMLCNLSKLAASLCSYWEEVVGMVSWRRVRSTHPTSNTRVLPWCCCMSPSHYSLISHYPHQILPRYLSCVSLSCLHMAAKVTEEECNLAPTDELIRIGQCRFTVSDLNRMEKIVAEKLSFQPKVITALTFLHLYHQIMLSHSTERWGSCLLKSLDWIHFSSNSTCKNFANG